MKRSTLFAVLGAAGVLIAAGYLPSLPEAGGIADARAALASLGSAAGGLSAFVLAIARGPLPYAAAGMLCGLALLRLALRLLRPADPRRRVLVLARQGRPLPQISRSVRLPLDTVRAMLRPAAAPRLPR